MTDGVSLAQEAVEKARIEFVRNRDGAEVARAWALDTARTYRKVLVLRKTHLMYRLPMIRSYLALKRYGLRGTGGQS